MSDTAIGTICDTVPGDVWTICAPLPGYRSVSIGVAGARGGGDQMHDGFDGGAGEMRDEAVPQSLPTMSSEHEFPRLGADAVAMQLGTAAMSLDDNDSRTAFTSGGGKGDKGGYDDSAGGAAAAATDYGNGNGAQSGPSPQSGPSLGTSGKPEKMSNNFAISVKKSAGNLSSNDFPSLSSSLATADAGARSAAGRVPDFSGRAKSSQGVHQLHQQQQQQQQAQLQAQQMLQQMRPSPARHNEDEFPSLRSGGGAGGNEHKAAANKQWGSANRTEAAPTMPDETRPVETAPKVSLVSRDDWLQASAAGAAAGRQASVLQARQAVPCQQDFPRLGNAGRSVGNGAVGVTTKVGAWGKYSVPDSVPATMRPMSGGSRQARRTVVAASATSASTGGNKNKQQQHKASSHDNSNARHHNNNNGTSTGKEWQQQNDQSTEWEQLQSALPLQQPMRQHASLRGIDYIPNIVPPVQETISLVDQHQFSMIRAGHSSGTAGGNGNAFSLLSDSDFPGVASSGIGGHHQQQQPMEHAGNRFNALQLASDDPVLVGDHKKRQTGPAKAHAPLISSEMDFPSLPGSSGPGRKQPANQQQQGQAGTNQPQQTSHRNKNRQQKGPRAATSDKPTNAKTAPAAAQPVVSLMDVAMRVVSQRSYTPFPDTDERNEAMFLLLFERLGARLATEFLQLSNQYRQRQLSVQDYLCALREAATLGDAGDGDEEEDARAGSCNGNDVIDAIGRMLPQMCVLLPDIPLQRSLMGGMPKEWVGELRECTRCEQVRRFDWLV